jgi:hypothetical protein
MTRERWGTFSVIDHKDNSAFVPEVLLYDRLVIPVPYNEEDRQRWTEAGWDPDLLDERLETLGDLALRSVWDEAQQQTFHQRMEQLNRVRFDTRSIVQEAKGAVPYQMTRMILAEQKPVKLPEGVSHVNVVSAYQSEKDFEADFILKEDSDDQSLLGLLLGQKIAVPLSDDEPHEALIRAIDLARSAEFRRKRRSLYKWQEDVLRSGIEPENAIEEMNQLIIDYNESVRKAVKTVYYKYAFTLAGIGLSLAGTVLNPLALAGAFVSIVKFATFDRKPVVSAGESEPAAMFHDVHRIGKWRWY